MMKKKIPSDIDRIYTPLFHRVSHLHVKWGIFCQLYASGGEVIDLLNSSSRGFFSVCHDVLVCDILLAIRRLTDPKQTPVRKEIKDNLSLERLASSIDEVKFPELKREIEKLLVESKGKCRFARELADKLIAHNDLPTNLHDRAALVSTAKRQNIDCALESICEVMNAVPRFFEDRAVVYAVASIPSDGTTLIACLRHAMIYREQLRELERSPVHEAQEIHPDPR